MLFQTNGKYLDITFAAQVPHKDEACFFAPCFSNHEAFRIWYPWYPWYPVSSGRHLQDLLNNASSVIAEACEVSEYFASSNHRQILFQTSHVLGAGSPPSVFDFHMDLLVEGLENRVLFQCRGICGNMGQPRILRPSFEFLCQFPLITSFLSHLREVEGHVLFRFVVSGSGSARSSTKEVVAGSFR